MSTNKVAVISLGTKNYEKGRLRLTQTLSVVDNYAGDFFILENESECDSPSHRRNPYAFKIYAFEKVREMGYNQILWLDCSVYAIKSITPIFDKISEDGYICQEAGHFVGTWTNDRTLIYFGLSRDDAMDMMMYGNAGFLGLDFNTEIANEFFNRWKQSMLDGMFIGDWNNNRHQESPDSRCMGHRHDMSCGSIIRHQLGMKLQSGNDYLQYVLDGPKVPNNDTVCLYAQGIG